MTARPGGTTRQGPKFLTEFVAKHFIDQDGDDGEEMSLRKRLGSALDRGDDASDDENDGNG